MTFKQLQTISLSIWIVAELIWASLLGNRYVSTHSVETNLKERTMNVVLIIPTGLGCSIGGHAGDANPVVKLLGACCDKLITHPNAVNASDINEMPANTLYVEGSMLDRFLEGKIQLEEVYYNKILVAVNKPVRSDTLNAVSAGRATIGSEIEILELNKPLDMIASMQRGVATGSVHGWRELVQQVSKHDFDALAIHTPITVPREVALNYFAKGGVNPWGGVEAKASRLIADQLNKPVAHAPIESMSPEDQQEVFNNETDPRMAAEVISSCYLHCVLKGLSRAPRVGRGLSVSDVDLMVFPTYCYGRPHRACHKAGIPMIYVTENRIDPGIKWPREHEGVISSVSDYLQAAGWIMAYRAGIHPHTVRRPLAMTKITRS